MSSFFYITGILGAIVVIVAGLTYPFWSRLALIGLVDWADDVTYSEISAEINLLDECSYAIVRAGTVKHVNGICRLLVLEEFSTFYSAKGGGITNGYTIYVLAVPCSHEAVVQFLEANPNYKYWTTLDYESLRLYHVKSLLRFRRNFDRLAEPDSA